MDESVPFDRQANHRVLVVEDDEAIRLMLEMALSSEGYDVQAAEHGGQALDILQHWQPDLILLDLMMPVLDGWAFRARQLANGAWSAIPVVVLSAAYEAAHQAEMLAAAAVITKPFELDRLLEMVARTLGGA
ncbi:MAG: response regulator [Chloroflexi bacterium]|nr:response regulator [Chloroflexota bacterium]